LNEKEESVSFGKIENIFPNLKTLVMIDMALNWKKLKTLSYLFPNVKELLLCYNDMSDWEN